MSKLFGDTHIGLVRGSNQDRFVILEDSDELSLAIVCDGMGGKNGGGEAATIAVDSATNCYEKSLQAGFKKNISESSVNHLFASVFSAANQRVYETSKQHSDLEGMGTTMVVALLHETQIYIGWAGDSRAYLVNETEETQLTKDHTVVQFMLDNHEITKTEALNHPQKHFITRAIGVAEDIEFDFIVQSISPGDVVLLCSDGLYAYLQPKELLTLVKKATKKNAVEPLIALALARGGSDNVTAVIMR